MQKEAGFQALEEQNQVEPREPEERQVEEEHRKALEEEEMEQVGQAEHLEEEHLVWVSVSMCTHTGPWTYTYTCAHPHTTHAPHSSTFEHAHAQKIENVGLRHGDTPLK